jgi:beta-glucosidase
MMNARSILATLCLATLTLSAPAQQQPKWKDTSLSADERASLLVEQLTLDEKIQLVHGIGWGPLKNGAYVPPDDNGGAGFVKGIPRLGIPNLDQADSAVGIRMAAPQSRYATLLPSVLGATASWDPQAAHLYGDVIGRELRAQGYNMSIGGGVDLARDPRNGRLFEYPGEDPVLAGVTVGNLILGVQSNQVMGDIKHFAFNDQETGRNTLNVLIDKRAARESDLLAFEIGIGIGHPSAVMCSYNRFAGDYACENDYLLNQVLKRDFHFPGFVVSDWEATHSTVKAANNGLDMEMPGEDFFGAPLKKAVESGAVPMQRLDDMVHRLLRSMIAAGVVEHPPTPRLVVDPFRGRDDAQHIAEESIVLLKNKPGTLPLSSTVRSIAIIGAHADVGVLSGGGSAQVDAPGGDAADPQHPQTEWQRPVYFPSSPLRYIREHARTAEVQYNDGKDYAAAAALAKSAQVAIVFVEQYMSEDRDAATLSLPNHQDDLVAAVSAANPNTIVVLETGNPVSMPWADKVAGIMEAWYPGIGGAQAIANLLFGEVNPSAKLPITFAKTEADLPHPVIFGLENIATNPKPRQGFDVAYTEGARFGYKWFDSEQKQPLFPFGFGLSYTTFAYSGLHIDAAARTVTFTAKNTGTRSGDEIAQVYTQLPPASGEHFRRLVAWQRIPLNAGEQKTVTLPLTPLYLSTFDTAKNAWQLLSGKYTVSVGGSSRALPLTNTFEVQ